MASYDDLISVTMARYNDLLWACYLYCTRTWHTDECRQGIVKK